VPHPNDHYHERDERTGLIALTTIIVGLLVVGVLQFSVTWFMAR
jgi:hypothetical protein